MQTFSHKYYAAIPSLKEYIDKNLLLLNFNEISQFKMQSLYNMYKTAGGRHNNDKYLTIDGFKHIIKHYFDTHEWPTGTGTEFELAVKCQSYFACKGQSERRSTRSSTNIIVVDDENNDRNTIVANSVASDANVAMIVKYTEQIRAMREVERQLKSTLDAANRKLESLVIENKNLEKSCNDAKAETTDLKKQLRTSQKKLAAAEKLLKSHENDLPHAECALNETKKIVEQLTADNEELKGELSKIKVDRDVTASENIIINSHNEKMRAELDEARAVIKNLKVTCSDYEKSYNSLKNIINKTQEEHRVAINERDKAVADSQIFQDTINELKFDNQQLKHRINTLMHDVDVAWGSNSKHDLNLMTKEKKEKTLMTEINRLSVLIHQLSADNKILHGVNVALRKDNDDSELRINDVYVESKIVIGKYAESLRNLRIIKNELDEAKHNLLSRVGEIEDMKITLLNYCEKLQLVEDQLRERDLIIAQKNGDLTACMQYAEILSQKLEQMTQFASIVGGTL